MRAGRRRHLARLESLGDDALNASGQAGDKPTVRGTAYVEIRPLGAMERQEAGRKYGEVTHQITQDGYDVRPTPAMRWVWHDSRDGRDRVFEVVGVLDYDERGFEIRSICREAQ